MPLFCHSIAFTVAALIGLTALAPEAEAYQQRGRQSQAQRRRQQEAIKKYQEQVRAYQADVARYQREMATRNEEIMKRFDENGDGRLLGPEKSKYDKYMYDVQKGKEQNPFADIKPPGQGTPATKP